MGNIRSRAVEKLDKDGNVIATYASLSEAAKLNDLAFQNVWKVCATEYKTSLKGFYYRYKVGN